MADPVEDTAVFDTSMKKKKKKAPKEEVEAVTEGVDEMTVDDPALMFGDKKKKKKKAAKEEDADGAAAEGEGDDEFSFGEKKKKKKKKTAEEGGAEEEAAEDDDEFGSFGGKKKKKKKQRDVDDEEEAVDDISASAAAAAAAAVAGGVSTAAEEEEEESSKAAVRQQNAWDNSDRDYEYSELLGRVFTIIRENNPELGGIKKRFAVKPPMCHRDGTKKTVFDNLIDICEQLHRSPDHMVAFILAELGTSGSIDGNQRLVIRGRFQPKGLESVIRRYVAEYVTCHMCKSPETGLTKENRLHFLSCESCGASRSVAPIKQGFMALVGKRRNMKPA